MAVPGASKAFADELVAERDAVAKDFAQIAAVTVVIAAGGSKFERAGVEKFEQALLRGLSELFFAGAARRVDFGRVDIGDPDLSAVEPEGVAVDDAIAALAGATEGERAAHGWFIVAGGRDRADFRPVRRAVPSGDAERCSEHDGRDHARELAWPLRTAAHFPELDDIAAGFVLPHRTPVRLGV